ncbi:class I SAM-dependent methyltransferase [Comamonadaceae bacterium OH2545_COT-014]|nr:class I SAM-dependent methyltransferase [Comamonadaceae bacterium OH2545_COT-014]
MTAQTRNPFDARARDWDTRPISRQLADVPPRLLARLPLTGGEHVLDFGAGTGLLAAAIAPHAASVTALDTSAGMLQVLREKGLPNVQTLQQDIHDGLPRRYDAIVSCMALHHVADLPALLRAFAHALAPGGRVALVDLYAEDGSFHGDNAAKGVHHLGFEPARLQRQAEDAGLADVGFEEIARIQRESRAYPLFLMTGRRAEP